MRQRRVLLIAAFIMTTGSVAVPYAQQDTEVGPGRLPSNPFCRFAACGYGRDGIPEPYAGGGLSGNSARAYAAGSSGLFPAGNASMMSWLSSSDIAGQPTNLNDIWGYTSPAGREYAIVGLKTGTAFVDITDPVAPFVVEVIPGPVSDWRDMAVYKRWAYSVNETGGGIQVIDLREIDEGAVTQARRITADGLVTSHNIFVNEDSGYAYLLGSNLSRGGLVAVDLRDPGRPSLERVAWDIAYVHDVQVVSYARGKYKGREIAFAFTGLLGLHIIDVTDKSRPITLGHLRYDGTTYGHSGWLSPNRRFLYLNDELDERANPVVDRMTTYVIRVGDLEKPRLVRKFEWDLPAIDHNSMVQGDKLYLSAYRGGLRVLDIAKPRRPRVAAFFDTYPADDEARFTGAWGVFAGFPSGNVVVSDIERGLFVIRVD